MDTPFVKPSRLGFQARLTIVAGAAVAATVAIAAVAVYLVAQAQLDLALNTALEAQAESATVQVLRGGIVVVRSSAFTQVLDSSGKVLPSLNGASPMTITPDDVAVASGDQPDNPPHDGMVGPQHVRIYTFHVEDRSTGASYAIQIALDRTGVENALNRLKLVLLVVAAGGIVLGGLLGRLIAQAGLRPIHRLRQAVDHVTETGDMSQRVPYTGEDELGRLGTHFNRMLDGLDQSLKTQRQLVADASHELRTPLSSLRTNVEVLQRSPHISPFERDRLMGDVISQVEQLTRLIQDLIDLARGDQAPQDAEEVRLDWIVAAAAERAATHWPLVHFNTDLAESVIVGQANRLDRAVSNLLDNAGKWSPPGQVVDVVVAGRQVIVRDHGPGIDPADLPYVFDRFWRAPAARAMPGSGLGLAIVRQVAESHGGTVTAELPPGGGTLMRLHFPAGGETPFGRQSRTAVRGR